MRDSKNTPFPFQNAMAALKTQCMTKSSFPPKPPCSRRCWYVARNAVLNKNETATFIVTRETLEVSAQLFFYVFFFIVVFVALGLP